MTRRRALADTSIFIGVEAARFDADRFAINDSWIAATAIRHGVPVVTRDSDYDVMPGLEVIKV